MEQEVCKFWKFGFCRFREGCHRKHFTEVCDQLSRFKNIKECYKRHPKRCKKFTSGKECRFQEDCAYDHSRTFEDEEKKELKEKLEILEKTVVELTNKVESEKIQQLEKVVKAMCRKVLCLESEKNI